LTAADRLFGALPALLANAALELDPAARARLAALEGACIRVECQPPGLATSIVITNGRLAVAEHSDTTANVIVRGSAAALFARLVTSERAPGLIEVDGDATTLAEFEAVFRTLRPDLGEALGRIAPRELADTLAGGAELAIAALRSAFDAFAADGRARAARRFTARAPFEQLRDELDELALATDRLEARIARAEDTRAGAPRATATKDRGGDTSSAAEPVVRSDGGGEAS
jgi:ubiquinone biosynthesis protein UbiJ